MPSNCILFLRYRKDGNENYQYIDVVPTGTNHFEVQDLKVGTKYSFSIKAYNSLGESSYTADIGKVETKSKLLLSLFYYLMNISVTRNNVSWLQNSFIRISF